MPRFDLDDFRKQIGTMKKMGSMRDLMSKIPGMGQMRMENLGGIDADDEVKRIQGIIDGMTPAERRDPAIIDVSSAGGSPREAGSIRPMSPAWSSNSTRWRPSSSRWRK